MGTLSKEKKLVSAVIYLHNDEDRIVEFLKTVIQVLKNNFESFEIIIVNDCSYDDSVERMKNDELLKKFNVSIVNMSIRQGLEVSMTAGIDLSMGDFVYEFDDLTLDYDEHYIMKAYHHIVSGFDIVSVAPTKDNSLLSGFFYKIFNNYSKSRYKLRSERFRILSRRAINRAYSISKAIPYRKALYANSGLKMDSLAYTQKRLLDFKSTKEKSVFRNKMALNSIIIYTNLAFQIAIGITFLLFSITLFSGIYAFIVYFSDQKPIEGWTTTMLLMSSSFSGLFFILAIIIKYLSLIVELIYSKKTYLVESVDRI
ncbi:MAG TPA: glycosyltransferase [Flavobacterium sp.]|uniref:glycosyltransferase n=1 Tax=unclassified Flavobacterium TaxID=196869 RepID=UPI0025C5E8AA|nr:MULTISPECIES: glycosyltransferase [unclassified Flavobacterium]HRE77841.1 glycosyltransferase [Flavobacterium sp.]